MAKMAGARWNGEHSTREEASRAKRALVLREAGIAFSIKGFHNTSMDDIAARLGLTKTSLYYYFRNKDEILTSCLDRGLELAEDALAAALVVPGTTLDKVTTFVRLYVGAMTSELGAYTAALELQSTPQAELPRIKARMRDFDRRLRALVQAGIDDGSIASLDPALAVNWMMGAMALLPRWFRPDRALGPDKVAEGYAAMARRMLQADA